MDESAAYRNLIIEAVIWLAGLAGCFVALVLSRSPSRNRRILSFILATTSMLIGYLGLFTPFTFWPRIAYSWANGDFRVALDVNRFFGVPLALGAVALWLAIYRRGKLKTT